MVHVTATEGIENTVAEPSQKRVWAFRAAAQGGSGLFVDSAQSLGNNRVEDVALGDLDGDGDLDAFVANFNESNHVWLNQSQLQDTPPRITEILVRGTTWTPAFLNHLLMTGAGTGGFSIPQGASQLDALRWGNTDQIIIRFSEGVVIPAGAIQVTGVLGPDGLLDANVDYPFTIATQIGETGQFEAVLALATPLGVNKLLIKVNGSSAAAVSDPGGTVLDGEWTDTMDTFPSGDGSAGGDFHFRFDSLSGNADIDGSVGDRDLSIMLSDFGKAPPTPLIDARADMDGDLSVGDRDLSILLTNFGKSLPTGVPTAPAAHGAPADEVTPSTSPLAVLITSQATIASTATNPATDASSSADVDLIATMQVPHRGGRPFQQTDKGVLWRFARPSMQVQRVVRLRGSDPCAEGSQAGSLWPRLRLPRL